MRDLCLEGHTVIVAIHQPRSSIYALFDDLLLLSDGRVSRYRGVIVVVVAVDDGDSISAQFVLSATVMSKSIPVGAARDVDNVGKMAKHVWYNKFTSPTKTIITKNIGNKTAAATRTATAPGAAIYIKNDSTDIDSTNSKINKVVNFVSPRYLVQVMYHGSMNDVLPRLASLGHKCPSNFNPADFMVRTTANNNEESEVSHTLERRNVQPEIDWCVFL